MSDEENEYGITNARRTKRDEFGNAIINEDEDIDRVTMNSEDVFSRDDTTNDDYYQERRLSIFSEDSEFLRNAQNAAAHRNRGAGFNPFGMNMNSASTRNVRSSSGRDMRRIIINNNNNNNNNNNIVNTTMMGNKNNSKKQTEIESDTDEDDAVTTPL